MSHAFENEPCEVIVDEIFKDKCQESEVEYVGHIFSFDGVKPSIKNISAILAIPAPENKIIENKKELQKFMGMINFIGEFFSESVYEKSTTQTAVR